MSRQRLTPCARGRLEMSKSLPVAVLGWLALHACVDGHAIPGTREGLLVDGGDGDSGDGDGGDEEPGDEPDAAPPPPMCVPAECSGAVGLLGTTPPCCTDDDRCGLDFSALGLAECLEHDAPGPVDSACPSASVFGLLQFPGCCARGGVCGRLIEAFFPLGCVPSDVDIPIPGLEARAPVPCNTFNAPGNAPE